MNPCDQCPWVSKAARDKAALTPTVRAAAEDGQWFRCHVNMGTCHGAAAYTKRHRNKLKRESKKADDRQWMELTVKG